MNLFGVLVIEVSLNVEVPAVTVCLTCLTSVTTICSSQAQIPFKEYTGGI